MGWVAPIKDEDTLNKFENALRELDEKYYEIAKMRCKEYQSKLI